MTPRKPRDLPGVELRQRRHRDGTAYWVWRVRWRDPSTGRRLVETCHSEQDALDFQAHLRLLGRRGQLADLDQGRELLKDFALQWWAEYAATNIDRTTLATYRSIYNNHLLPRVGGLELRQIKPRTVHALRRDLETDGVGAPTIRKAMGMLQAMFREAVNWGLVDTNPVPAVRKPPAGRARDIVALTVAQVEAILTHLTAAGGGHPLLAELIAYTGARPQDALALPWSRVGRAALTYAAKTVDGEIRPGAKTGPDKSRQIETLPVVRRDLLAARMAAGNPSADQLVVPGIDGKPWTDQAYRSWRRYRFGPAAAAAGVDGATPYWLRHTYASLRLAEQRLSLHEISAELGHSVEVLARTYSHVIADLKGQGPVDANQLIEDARCPQDAPTKEIASS